MNPGPQPDMEKVVAAVKAIEARRRARADALRLDPPASPPPAVDTAIRKPLTSHGDPCRGFDYYHFLNRD